ncbi:hypothetical protein HDU97_003410 [Phlyctochytrium planicorne]|nr:hypothetical protein HDU97_003410 [Phlyctochytrium planicorne]
MMNPNPAAVPKAAGKDFTFNFNPTPSLNYSVQGPDNAEAQQCSDGRVFSTTTQSKLKAIPTSAPRASIPEATSPRPNASGPPTQASTSSKNVIQPTNLESGSLARDMIFLKIANSRYPLHQPKTLLEQLYLDVLSMILSQPKWWEPFRAAKASNTVWTHEKLHKLMGTTCDHCTIVPGGEAFCRSVVYLDDEKPWRGIVASMARLKDSVHGSRHPQKFPGGQLGAFLKSHCPVEDILENPTFLKHLLDDLICRAKHSVMEVHKPSQLKPFQKLVIQPLPINAQKDQFSFLRNEVVGSFWQSSNGSVVSDDIVSTKLLCQLLDSLPQLTAEGHNRHNRMFPGTKVSNPFQILNPTAHLIEYCVTKYSPKPEAVVGTESVHRNYLPRSVHESLKESRCPRDRFQWLPTDCVVDGRGKANIDGYIPGIDKKYHAGFYSALERLIDALLPMFERAVDGYDRFQDQRRISPEYPYSHTYSEFVEELALRMRMSSLGSNGKLCDEEDDGFRKYLLASEDRFRPMVPMHPSCGTFADSPLPSNQNPKWSFMNRRLQFVLRLETMTLPFYGNTYHLEGCSNDAVAAVAVVPLEIGAEDVLISFGEYVERMERKHDDGFDERIHRVFGCGANGSNIQRVGAVRLHRRGEDISGSTPPRVVVFPNKNLHRLHPMKPIGTPAGKSSKKSGKVTLLYINLVHPSASLPSTRNIPPQRCSDFLDTIRSIIPLPDIPLRIIADYLTEEKYLATDAQMKKRMETNVFRPDWAAPMKKGISKKRDYYDSDYDSDVFSEFSGDLDDDDSLDELDSDLDGSELDYWEQEFDDDF